MKVQVTVILHYVLVFSKGDKREEQTFLPHLFVFGDMPWIWEIKARKPQVAVARHLLPQPVGVFCKRPVLHL